MLYEQDLLPQLFLIQRLLNSQLINLNDRHFQLLIPKILWGLQFMIQRYNPS